MQNSKNGTLTGHLDPATDSKIQKRLDTYGAKITHIDYNGHQRFAAGQIFDLTVKPADPRIYHLWQDSKRIAENSDAFKTHLTEAMNGGSPAFRTAIKNDSSFNPGSRCDVCGERFSLIREGSTLRASTPCPHPGGMKPYAVDIEVPSGEIVFATDLRPLAIFRYERDESSQAASKRTSHDYATDGIAYLITGPEDPIIIRTEKGLELALNKGDQTDDFDEDEDATLPGYEGFISTPEWWSSAMDRDLFLKRCVDKKLSPDDFETVVVKVDPGRYAFSNQIADSLASGYVRLVLIEKVHTDALEGVSAK